MDRRVAARDRRERIIQVQRDRRTGADRRLRNLRKELERYQHLRAAAETEIAKYKWAIQNRPLAEYTIQRYVRYIFQSIDCIHKYEKEIRSIEEKVSNIVKHS